jgi:hypothetical protein
MRGIKFIVDVPIFDQLFHRRVRNSSMYRDQSGQN